VSSLLTALGLLSLLAALAPAVRAAPLPTRAPPAAPTPVSTAAPSFAEAATARHARAQIEYLQPFVAGKAPPGQQPAKSLLQSFLKLYSGGVRPPLDIEAMSFDRSDSGESWLAYAESLYASEEYARAEQALQQLPAEFRSAQSERVESLMLRLAWRGFGKAPLAKSAAIDTRLRFNQILRLGRSAATADGEGRAGALARLRTLAGDAKAAPATRQRARLWIAALALEQNDRRAGLEALAAPAPAPPASRSLDR
jgi:hypothetical protein